MTSGAALNDPSLKEQLAGMLAFLRRALRFWRVLLGTLCLGGVAFAVFSHFRQPTFRSETVILYVQKGSSDEGMGSTDAQHAVTARLKELLFSRPNLERVVSQFNLYAELRKAYGMVDAVEELKKHVAFRAPGGDTFSIAFEGTGASEAQRVTAELARLVVIDDAELRTGQAKVALGFLAGERQVRDAELRDTEGKLAAFMAEHPRFALDVTPLANGAAIRATIGGVQPAAAAVAVGRGSWVRPSPRGVSAAHATPDAPAATDKGGDDGELRARAELATARDSLTKQLTLYTPVHPDVRAAEAAVQRATQRLAALTSAAATTPAPVSQPAPVPAAVPAIVWRAPRAVAVASGPVSPELPQDLVTLETAWLTLTRAVTEARQRLDQVEEQLFRADILMSSESAGHGAQVNVIDPAFLPERPLPPGRAMLALIFLAIALMLGGLGALLSAAFDDRLFDARDLAGIGEVLAEVPWGRSRRAHGAS